MSMKLLIDLDNNLNKNYNGYMKTYKSITN